MSKQIGHPCDDLLQQWQGKRELANYYFRALLRLSPDAPDAPQRRRELNEKVVDALYAWQQVEEQLQGCYQEHGQSTQGVPSIDHNDHLE